MFQGRSPFSSAAIMKIPIKGTFSPLLLVSLLAATFLHAVGGASAPRPPWPVISLGPAADNGGPRR